MELGGPLTCSDWQMSLFSGQQARCTSKSYGIHACSQLTVLFVLSGAQEVSHHMVCR